MSTASKLLTLDFETMPDVDQAEYLTGFKSSLDPLKSCDQGDFIEDVASRLDALKVYAKERYEDENALLAPGLNKIVAGGIHLANIRFDQNIGEWYETTHVSSTSDGEQKIVTDFVTWFDKMTPRFVSFNGRSFDFPLLMQRALRYGVPMGFWWKSGDKWQNYTSRYAPEYHFDVLDFISCNGAAPRMKLRELMSILRLPDKVYSGANVTELWLGHDIAGIRNYCELDCFNTFLCYVYCQHLNGSISDQGRDVSLRSALSFLMKNDTQEHIKRFLSEWCLLNPVIQDMRLQLSSGR